MELSIGTHQMGRILVSLSSLPLPLRPQVRELGSGFLESRTLHPPLSSRIGSRRGLKPLRLKSKQRAARNEHLSSWDDKPYESLPGGRKVYLDEQDVLSFLDPPKELIPLDPASYNPAAYLWKKIGDIPEERRHNLLRTVKGGLISRLWELAGTRYQDAKFVKLTASPLLSLGNNNKALEIWNCRASEVPISVVAAFKKIKSLVHNNSQLAMALRTSSKLVVSDDGKRVRRQQLFTESDLEMLQSRIVVAENLPEDHCYQNLMKIFSSVGCVKTIRTCYPPSANGTAPANNKPTRLEMLFGNRLHAFVEYESIEDAEKAVAELNDEKNWRNGLRVKLFHKFLMKHGPARGRRGQEGDFNGEEDVSTSNQSNERLVGDAYHSSEVSHDHENDENFNEKDGALRRGRGRGRGGRRGRSQHHNNNRGVGHLVGTPPSSHSMHSDREQLAANKQPPGPRMPDGTRGFTLGRGKPVTSTSTV